MTLEKSAYLKFKKGMPLPEFDLVGIDDQKHRSTDLKTKATLIVFMCNHCPYVKPKVSKLVELQQKYQTAGLQIVGINSNNHPYYPEDSFPKMKEFAKANKINFLYLFDDTQNVARSFDAKCTPDLYIFNGQRKLVYHGRIDNCHQQVHTEKCTNELEEAIIQTLKTGSTTVSENPSQGCSIKWQNEKSEYG